MRYTGIKGKAWEAVKRYVRAKEKDCYTCDAKNLVGYNAQAGHCFPVGYVGSNNRLSWDERQIHLQCGRCNGPGQGMQGVYKPRLAKEYGADVVAEMEKRQHRVDPIKDWHAIIAHYEQMTEELAGKTTYEKANDLMEEADKSVRKNLDKDFENLMGV